MDSSEFEKVIKITICGFLRICEQVRVKRKTTCRKYAAIECEYVKFQENPDYRFTFVKITSVYNKHGDKKIRSVQKN